MWIGSGMGIRRSFSGLTLSLPRRLGGRQREMDGGAARPGGHPEAAAMRLDDRFAQRQAEAKPLLLGGGERQERALGEIGRKTGASVAHPQLDEIGVGR